MVKRGLVLSGGGAKGAFEAGAIQSLTATGNFDIVTGTSIGSINAALTAQGQVGQLGQVWHEIPTLKPAIISYTPFAQNVLAFVALIERMQQIPNRTLQNLFRLVADWEALGAPDSFLHLLGVLDRAPIDALLTKYLDFSKIKGTLALTATNLTQGTSDAFYLIEGDERVEQAFINVREPDPSYTLTRENYKLAVEASASIPMAWEPVVMNLGGATPNKYVDGGVANNAPVRIAAQLGATDITVILLDPAQTKPRDQALNGPSDILSASLDVMFQKILEDDMQLARQIPGVTINTVRPAAPLGIGVLEFSNAAAIEAAFQTGVAAGQHPVKLLL